MLEYATFFADSYLIMALCAVNPVPIPYCQLVQSGREIRMHETSCINRLSSLKVSEKPIGTLPPPVDSLSSVPVTIPLRFGSIPTSK